MGLFTVEFMGFVIENCIGRFEIKTLLLGKTMTFKGLIIGLTLKR